MTSPNNPQLRLSDAEALALDELANDQSLTQEQVLRQALRLYQLDALKRRTGYHAVYVDDKGNREPARPSMQSEFGAAEPAPSYIVDV